MGPVTAQNAKVYTAYYRLSLYEMNQSKVFNLRGRLSGACRANSRTQNSAASNKPPPSELVVGIDLGTTNSAVAYIQQDGRWEWDPAWGL